MYGDTQNLIQQTLKEIREAGLYKEERVILSPQRALIRTQEGEVVNFCANNYLGLADNAEVVDAAVASLKENGYGMSSVRFICGTHTIHKKLEQAVSDFLGMDDTILYSSCFDANGGLFETLLGPDDAIISDALNHASIIDGVRLCKAQRHVYKNRDMGELEEILKKTQSCRQRMIATDGVFSMDGAIADLKSVCDLAEKYNALVMVDDSHATGFVGEHGRGTPELCGVEGRIDVITSTFGKALGGASGGFTSGRKEIVELLRQRSRPYLFSNTLATAITAATIKTIELVERSNLLRERLNANTEHFRKEMSRAGFEIKGETHPIVPVMLGDAKLAVGMADDLLGEGIYVIGFSFPVVPKGQARIRVQISAAHQKEHIDQAISAFERIGKKHGVI